MKRKASYWVLGLSLLLQLVLALTPFFPLTKGWWPVADPQQFYGVLATFIGVDLALIGTTFGVIFITEAGAFRREVSALTDRVPPSRIQWLADQEFYRVFLTAAKQARHSVRIAYFAPDPPGTVPIRDRDKYYREMRALMTSSTSTRFYRLVRFTDSNKPWILEMVQDFTGKATVSLAALTRDVGEASPMPLALSIQVVDDSHAWLVAVESHEREGEYRDLYVNNREFAEAMTRYYKRLWAAAIPLVINGKPTDAAGRLTQRGTL